MKAVSSRSFVVGRSGVDSTTPSRPADSLRSAVSIRCATTSRTRHVPASVGRCQSSGVSVRSNWMMSAVSGRNRGRVSAGGRGTAGSIAAATRELYAADDGRWMTLLVGRFIERDDHLCAIPCARTSRTAAFVIDSRSAASVSSATLLSAMLSIASG